MAGAFPINATVVDPSTKTVHREVPAMASTIRRRSAASDRSTLIRV